MFESLFDIINYGGWLYSSADDGIVRCVALATLVKIGGVAMNMHAQKEEQNRQTKMIQNQIGTFTKRIGQAKEYFTKVKDQVKKGFDVQEKNIFENFLDSRAKVENVGEKAISKSNIVSGEVAADAEEDIDAATRRKQLESESLDFKEEEQNMQTKQRELEEVRQLEEGITQLNQQQKEVSSVSDFDRFMQSIG